MKRVFPSVVAGLVAVCLVTFSAFTKNEAFAQVKYAIYVSGPQTAVGSYVYQNTLPATCINDVRLCWIKVSDVDEDGQVEQDEFTPIFTDLDQDDDNSLDDESEIAGILEKQN